MTILIDTSPLANANAIRGVGRYTRELVDALQKLDANTTILTSAPPGSASPQIIHYPFFDLFFPTLPLRKAAPTVVTIHDVIPLLFPKHYPRGIRGNLGFAYQRLSLRGVKHIITDSENSKRDITEKLGIAQDQITVVPLAASPSMTRPPQSVLETVRKKFALPKYYALYVGDINYNKNIPFLINALKHVPKLSLVLVGQAFKNTTIPEGRAIADAIRTSQLGRRIKIIDSLGSDAMSELAALYALATAYVQPSLYEGFGLPVLEAMQCKTPVVCARAGSLPEVAGDAALYFHPLEEDTLVSALTRILHYTKLQRATMVKKGSQQAALFSWEKTARATLAVYEKVAKAAHKR